ncbi:Mu transposase domain-containing protein [Streptomyces griseofuscus]|uniref:Mu transposase domain-containing protein n=1 Tax=Streptomyces griseofuscus TaxID=146922 RepID=UPI003F4DD0AE
MDAAFLACMPRRRAQIHKTHREVVAERAARDHAALKPLPPTLYLVAERQLGHVGKDCLVAFDGNLYSVSARRVRPRQLVEIRAAKSQVVLHSTLAAADGSTLLATHSEPSAAGPVSSTRRTGTVCRLGRVAGPRAETSLSSLVTNGLRARTPARCRAC